MVTYVHKTVIKVRGENKLRCFIRWVGEIRLINSKLKPLLHQLIGKASERAIFTFLVITKQMFVFVSMSF